MRSVVLAVLAMLATPAIYGDDKPANKSDPKPKQDAQSTHEPKSGPGEGQKFLERMVGEWDVTKTFYPRGGGEASRASGECKQSMIHGGRFLQSDFVFGSGADRSTGMGIIGFEPSSGKFTSVWTDSRQTRMSFRQAQDKFDGEQIVLFSKALGEENESRRSRTVTKTEENGNRVAHRQYNINADGSERLVMELMLTRKAVSTPKK
ncbi:MAG: DUF1579 family protein [Gemmataceae bacterium]